MEAHPSRNIPGVRPSPNTPSDVSCSSGPCSVVSTRETSPASSTHYPLETSSAARDLFISCPDLAGELPPPGPDLSRPRADLCRLRGLNAEIPSSSPLEMNPNPFRSVTDRRGKLVADDPRASHTSSGATTDGSNIGHRLQSTPVRRSLAPSLAPIAPPHPSSVLPPSSTIPRRLSTTNWRSSTASLDNLTAPSPATPFSETSCAPRDTNTRAFATASNSNLLCSPIANLDSRSNKSHLAQTTFVSVAGFSSSNRPPSAYRNESHLFDYQNSDRNTAKMHPQYGKIIADADMDHAMSYCYDRGGGQFTRLVPVDMLPVELKNIPRRVTTDEGMIVLPMPRQPGPDGQPANIQLEPQPAATPPSSPNGVATDNIQSRIDSIINATPGSGSGPLVLSARGFDGTTPTRSLAHQPHGAAVGSARREKIYCDKWIHDGTCAFTQQGCKYKHEMPHDRETQEKLGLFHGYPAWWKKQAVEQQRPLAIDDRPVNLSTGRPLYPAITTSTSLGSGMSSAVVSSNWRSTSGPVGDSIVQRSPSSPSPTAGSGSSAVTRGGSIGFGGSGRSSARQPRTFASFQPPPTYGPIAPPSRAGGSGSGTTATTISTRSTRALTASSVASNNEDEVHGGAPYNMQQQRPVFDTNNPFAPLSDLTHSARAAMARRDESSSGDTTADGEEQRGAPL